MHAGGSRLLVIDVDNPADMPARLWNLLQTAVFRPTTTDLNSRRSHYFYRLRSGQQFGNPKFAGGEVRCVGGAIMLAPSPHPKADKGHAYHSGPAEPVPFVPERMANNLTAVPDVPRGEPLVDADLEAFFAEHTGTTRPAALKGVLSTFEKYVAEGQSRHASLVGTMTFAFEEAIAGFYPARDAYNELSAAFMAHFGDPSKDRTWPEPGEAWDVARWAVPEAKKKDPEGRRAQTDRLDDEEDARERRIAIRVRDLLDLDEARHRAAEQQARKLLHVNADRAIDGLTFLTADTDAQPLWGEGSQVLWAPGEGLMICGPQGVGKSTVIQQLVLSRMGLREAELFGFPVVTDDRPILYLAMDRPPQIRRSIRRMLDLTDETVAATVKRQLIVWTGPPQINAAEAPDTFARWVAARGHDPGLVIVDSMKDLTGGLSKDEVGAGINEAMQRVLTNGTDFISAHHQRKANAENKKPNTLSDVYGSGWLTAGQGSVVLLWGQAGASTIELSHLKQPAEKVGPLVVIHTHAAGESATIDLRATLMALAARAGSDGITEADGVRAIYDIGPDDDGYTAAKSRTRRKLDALTAEGAFDYEAGTRGGSGGGGKAARWRMHCD